MNWVFFVTLKTQPHSVDLKASAGAAKSRWWPGCVADVFGSLDNDGYERTLCLLNPNTNEVKMFVMDIGLNFYDDLFNHVESLEPVRGRTLI